MVKLLKVMNFQNKKNPESKDKVTRFFVWKFKDRNLDDQHRNCSPKPFGSDWLFWAPLCQTLSDGCSVMYTVGWNHVY